MVMMMTAAATEHWTHYQKSKQSVFVYHHHHQQQQQESRRTNEPHVMMRTCQFNLLAAVLALHKAHTHSHWEKGTREIDDEKWPATLLSACAQ